MGGPGMGSPATAGQPGTNDRGGRGGTGERGGATGMAPSQQRTPQQLLTANTKLTSRLATLLGVPSSQVPSMAGSFKNLGQFVAAAHVSKNLNIPFSQLETAMKKDRNLGKAIHSLRPDLNKNDVKSAVSLSNHEAKQDIDEAKQAGQ